MWSPAGQGLPGNGKAYKLRKGKGVSQQPVERPDNSGSAGGAAADAASREDVLFDFYFHPSFVLTGIQKGHSRYTGYIPLGIHGQIPSRDAGDPHTGISRQRHIHPVPDAFQGEPEDVKSTGEVGNGSRAKNA
jgi:hypothetical protein